MSEISCCIETTVTESVDPDSVSVSRFDVGFEIVFKFDPIGLADFHLEDAVLFPGSISLERLIHPPTVRVVAHVVGNGKSHHYLVNVSA